MATSSFYSGSFPKVFPLIQVPPFSLSVVLLRKVAFAIISQSPLRIFSNVLWNISKLAANGMGIIFKGTILSRSKRLIGTVLMVFILSMRAIGRSHDKFIQASSAREPSIWISQRFSITENYSYLPTPHCPALEGGWVSSARVSGFSVQCAPQI